MSLQRSDRAKYAVQVFYRSFNDVDVFIEDTAAEAKKIYVNLLGRAFGGELSFAQVFPIGSKDRVYQRCAADQGIRERPAIYIVDGDHDELLGKLLPPLKRLFRLPRYCVENYLFDSNAAVSYLDDEFFDRSRSELESALGFDDWFRSIAAGLAQHLCAVIVAHRKGCGEGLPRSNVRLSKLCTAEDGTIDGRLIGDVVGACLSAVDAKCGPGSFETETSTVRACLGLSDEDAVLRFVSGKSLLLPLLRRRIRAVFGHSKDETLFRLRLSKLCDVSDLTIIRNVLQ